MKYNIWYDKIEGNWNVNIIGENMPIFEASTYEDCQQYVKRQIILDSLKQQ